MDWHVITTNVPDILRGVMITLSLVGSSLIIGFTFAIGLSLCVLSEKSYLKRPAQLYIFLIRGTPLIVQFFIIYYGVGQFTGLQHSFLWIFFKQPFLCAMLTLALNTSAYSSELFIGAVRSVPQGEVEACRALGMTWGLSLRRVIASHAWRLVLPAYSNEVVMLVKASSLASTVTVLELMGVTQRIINQTFLTIEFYCVAGIIYLLINSIFMSIFKQVERKYTTIDQK